MVAIMSSQPGHNQLKPQLLSSDIAEIATRAAAAGKSLNQWVTDVLDQSVHSH
jgi:predicted HicB family RNase H-like nuclease